MVHANPNPSITTATDSRRDSDIDRVCNYIDNVGRAGLRGLNYNSCVLNAEGNDGIVQQPGYTLDRGGSSTALSNSRATKTTGYTMLK